MKIQTKISLTAIALFASFGFAHAQSKLTPEQVHKDSIIIADIINPAEQDAQGEAPDWAALTKTITEKYDAIYADRTVTKAIIYFTYAKDWPAFTAAIVKYTEKYEPKDNLKLLDKNARMILKNSEDKKELIAALGWSKLTVDKEPTNTAYQQTYNDLKAKIAAK